MIKTNILEYLATLFCGIALLASVLSVPLFSLPIRNLNDEKYFIHLEVSKKSYYNTIPISSVFEVHKIEEYEDRFRLLVPREIMQSWNELGVEYNVLPYPNRLIDIDPSLETRINRGCVPLKSMLNGYKDSELNEIYLNCIQREYPNIVQLYNIGQSVEDRNLIALRIQIPGELPNISRTNVFFHCGIHGNEMIAIEHCYDIIIQSLTNSELIPYLKNIDLWVLPVANPDGLYRHWHVDIALGRGNSRGVDLNRNFPFKWNSGIPNASSDNPSHYQFRSYSPASEPEIQAILNLFDKEIFSFSMSIHCYANAILIPYSIPDTKNPEPNIAKNIGERLLKNVFSYRKDRAFITRKNLYPVDGTDQDTFYHRYGTLAYLFETSHLLERYIYIPMILEGLRPAWVNLLKETSSSYKWQVEILSEELKPIEATITSNRFKYFEGETRKASSRGEFQEVTPNGNKVNVIISHPDYISKTLNIYPSKNPIRYQIILKKNFENL